MTRPARWAYLGATAGLLVALGSALSFGKPGWATVAVLCVAWSAWVTLGVFFPSWQMFGPIVCRGPKGHARVALTFDDGPHPETTRRVLSLLAPTQHRATFFVLGEKVRRHPDVVREIRAAGHGLALHGDWHDRLHAFRTSGRVHAELCRARATLETIVGIRPRWFRPPIGHTSPSTVRGARRAGLTLVAWSARGYDGLRGRCPERVLRRIARDLDDGSIVLLHDAAERDDFEPASLGALPQLLQLLDARGLISVPLDDLLGSPDPNGVQRTFGAPSTNSRR